MIGGLKKTTSRFAIAAATGLFAGGLAFTPATAASLGGDCCADLEERVAELEATTARKGNRKMSLTVSGHVNTGVLFWDDGRESDQYVITSNNSRSRFRFKGKADIGRGWSAGYLIEIGVRDSDSSRVGQEPHTHPGSSATHGRGDDGNEGFVLDLRHNVWWIANKRLGTVSVGQTGSATEGATEVDLTGTFLSDGLTINFLNDGFDWRLTTGAGGGLSDIGVTTLLTELDGNRLDVVRYDTPTIAGFTLTAAWGEDDIWDVALRYANEFRGMFRVAAALGYLDDEDEGRNRDTIMGSASVLHIPTGLVASYSYGNRDFNTVGRADTVQHAFKVGITKKFNQLGKTSVSASYGMVEDGVGGTTTDFGGVGAISSSEGHWWGFGVVQKVDAAAMELYAGYRLYEIESLVVDTVERASDYEDFSTVIVGGRVRF